MGRVPAQKTVGVLNNYFQAKATTGAPNLMTFSGLKLKEQLSSFLPPRQAWGPKVGAPFDFRAFLKTGVYRCSKERKDGGPPLAEVTDTHEDKEKYSGGSRPARAPKLRSVLSLFYSTSSHRVTGLHKYVLCTRSF